MSQYSEVKKTAVSYILQGLTGGFSNDHNDSAKPPLAT
jgi:hypothetical protein